MPVPVFDKLHASWKNRSKNKKLFISEFPVLLFVSIFSHSNPVQLREESGVCVKNKQKYPTKISESLHVIFGI